MPPAGSADPTQSLLRWGIENSTPGSLIPLHEDIKAGRRPDLNSDMLKALMGTSDADRMKECVEVIEGRWVDRDGGAVKDADVTIEDKLRACEDLEMVS
jgi:hsp70-interacting protein